MSAYIQQSSVFSGRQFVMMVTIALHAALISALMAMKISTVISNPQPVLQWPDIKPDPQPPEPVAPRPDVRLRDWQDYQPQVPRPDVSFPPDDPPATPETSGSVEPIGTSPAQGAPIPATGLQFRAVRPADDYYPAAAIRDNEQGAAIVHVCVGADGRLAAAPVIANSSGSRRLDGAAVTWAREALQFTAATSGGVAVAACKDFRVNFTLH